METFTTSIPLPSGINPQNFTVTVIFTMSESTTSTPISFLQSADQLLGYGIYAIWLLFGYGFLLFLILLAIAMLTILGMKTAGFDIQDMMDKVEQTTNRRILNEV